MDRASDWREGLLKEDIDPGVMRTGHMSRWRLELNLLQEPLKRSLLVAVKWC